MENGEIPDSQITASSWLPPTNEPALARFRHGGYWCPAKADQVNENVFVTLPHRLVLPLSL